MYSFVNKQNFILPDVKKGSFDDVLQWFLEDINETCYAVYQQNPYESLLFRYQNNIYRATKSNIELIAIYNLSNQYQTLVPSYDMMYKNMENFKKKILNKCNSNESLYSESVSLYNFDSPKNEKNDIDKKENDLINLTIDTSEIYDTPTKKSDDSNSSDKKFDAFEVTSKLIENYNIVKMKKEKMKEEAIKEQKAIDKEKEELLQKKKQLLQDKIISLYGKYETYIKMTKDNINIEDEENNFYPVFNFFKNVSEGEKKILDEINVEYILNTKEFSDEILELCNKFGELLKITNKRIENELKNHSWSEININNKLPQK